MPALCCYFPIGLESPLHRGVATLPRIATAQQRFHQMEQVSQVRVQMHRLKLLGGG